MHLPKIRMTRFASLALGLALLAAGCAPATPPQAAPFTPTSAPARPTQTALPTPPQPTHTAVAAPTLPAPAETPGVLETPDVSRYQVEARSESSPDGRWQVNTIVYWPPLDSGGDQPQYRVRVRVIELPDWKVTELLDEWRTYGLGLDLPVVLGWEINSSAVFLSNTGTPDGCGAPFYTGLRRVSLPSFESEDYPLNLSGRLVLLPDGSKLLAFDQVGLALLAVDGSETTTIPVELPGGEWLPDSLLLSPDGRQALYSLAENPCSSQTSGWLGLVDLATGETRQLLRQETRSLSLVSWPTAELAQLRSPQGETAWLSVETGEISAEPPAGVAQALAALNGFFAALNQGDYAAAAGFYGGIYDLQRDHNPSLPPDDLAGLWQNACQINGAQCLPLRAAVLVGAPAQGEYRFRVQFTADGELFSLGPCCGGAIEDFPPTSEFFYTVKMDAGGSYRVMDLPVYAP